MYDEGWWDSHPHCWDKSYTSDATYNELQEHFFRSTVFTFDGDLKELAIFHAMSEYHQRVVCISEHSRKHLEITFYCDQYGLHSKDRCTPPEYHSLFDPGCREDDY